MGPIVKAVVAILGTQYREMKKYKPLRICVNMVIVQKITSSLLLSPTDSSWRRWHRSSESPSWTLKISVNTET